MFARTMKYIPFTCAIALLFVIFGAGCSRAPSSTVSVPDAASTSSVESTPLFTSSTPIMQPALAFPGELSADQVNKKIRIKTTLGDIIVQVDRDMGPKAASNFVYLVKQGYYNGIIFHRVIPGFMIQGGDPTGTGMGGPGYEFANDTVKGPYSDGVVAMANAGRDTNGSQFFIMIADYPLPPDYSQFGRVIQGLDIAHKIAEVQRDEVNNRPNDDVKMLSVAIEE